MSRYTLPGAMLFFRRGVKKGEFSTTRYASMRLLDVGTNTMSWESAQPACPESL